MSILVATVAAMLQFLIGLYAELTLPPPPPGFASFGLAVMLGSIITAGLFAFIGAVVGCLIDVVIIIVDAGNAIHCQRVNTACNHRMHQKKRAKSFGS